ncbi:MAG: DUF2293 domain-containing protein [Lentisphaeria bacterium]|nr:DUF2293 domain-containing protein [Lentisphaeria bacterium]
MKEGEILVRGLSGKPNVFRDGKLISVPDGWIFVPSGDSLLTRRIKGAGEYWVHVRERKGRTESVGVWAPSENVESARLKIAAEREDPAYQKRLESGRKSREKKQTAYCQEFRQAVLDFLQFHPSCREWAEKFADAVVLQSAGVGSGTVARTQRIPIEKRAESAVIAWMRHQTTAYDEMKIARIKGKRFEVRRELAKQSRALLESFRQGTVTDPEQNPLICALNKKSE